MSLKLSASVAKAQNAPARSTQQPVGMTAKEVTSIGIELRRFDQTTQLSILLTFYEQLFCQLPKNSNKNLKLRKAERIMSMKLTPDRKKIGEMFPKLPSSSKAVKKSFDRPPSVLQFSQGQHIQLNKTIGFYLATYLSFLFLRIRNY